MASASQKNMLPQVVILTSTIPKGLQEMLQGVLRYAQERGPWRIYQQERRRWMYPLQDLKEWGCTGIIAADHHSAEEARQIVELGIPFTDIGAKENQGLEFGLRIYIGNNLAEQMPHDGYLSQKIAIDDLEKYYWVV